MKYLSLCSGIEAATAAWHPLGWEPFAFSEIDPFASAVLAHHYPHVPNLGDMTRFEEWDDADFDVLVGGTPCQSFSVAGLRGGLDDERGQLMLTYGRIAARYRPDWFVWENVPGVLSSAGGADFASFLGLLTGREIPAQKWQNSGVVEGIDSAYGVAWRVLDAQYIRVESHARAVPQRRRRVFVVGHLGDWRRAAAVLFERESLSGHPAPRREAGKAASRGVEFGPSGGGFTDVNPTLDARCKDGPIRNQLAGAVADIAHCVTAHTAKGGDPTTDTLVAHSLRADGFDASEDGTGRGTPIVPVAFAHQQGGSVDLHVSHDLRLTVQKSQTQAIAFQCQGSNVGAMGTLRSGNGNVTGGVPFTVAIQERAICENPNAGPDGVGIRDDGAAYTMEARRVPQAVAFDTTQVTSKANRSNPKPGDPCHPLASTAHPPAIATHMAVRRLTPRECERLQGFPDDYTLIPLPMKARKQKRGEPDAKYADYLKRRIQRHAADGPRYKALGNSMAVNAMSWIGEGIAAVNRLASHTTPGGRMTQAAIHPTTKGPGTMRFKKIRIANKDVELEWEEADGETTHQHAVKSSEPPTPAFVESLAAMGKHLPLVTDATPEYLETAEVRSVNITYDKNDQRRLSMSATRKVESSNSPLNLNTPAIVETEEVRDGSLFEGDVVKIRAVFVDFDALAGHAKRFIAGDRGEPAEKREKTLPGQMTIEEHISEADMIEATRAFLAIMGEKPANQGSSNKQLTNRVIHVFDGVTYEDPDGDRDAQRITGLYRHRLPAEEGGDNRVVWVRVSAEGDIPRLWYNAPLDAFDPAAHAPTLAGFQMVTILRQAWGMNTNGKAPKAVGDLEPVGDALATAGV